MAASGAGRISNAAAVPTRAAKKKKKPPPPTPPLSSCSRHRYRFTFRPIHPCRGPSRQANGKARALALLALHLDAAMVQLDRHLDEVKADPGADDTGDIAAAVIALEQAIEIVGGNTDTAIGDGNDNLVRGAVRLDLDRAAAR